MPKATHVLTVWSKSGKVVDRITGASTGSISIYGYKDLFNRLGNLKSNPDLDWSCRRVRKDGT
jgi:hypothetical protein